MERHGVEAAERVAARDWWEEHRGLQAAVFGMMLLLLSVFAHGQEPEVSLPLCRWEGARGDYLCSETTVFDGGWTRRSARRDYWLGSGDDAQVHARGEFRSVAEFTARVARGRFRGERAMVNGAGQVRLLATWLPGVNGRRVYLLAARGAGEEVSARFFAASLDGDGGGSVAEIPVFNFGVAGLEEERDSWPTGAMPAGDPIRYSIDEVAVAGALRVLEVQVGEGTGEGRFWVAVDTSQGWIQGGAVRLSAEALIPGRATILAREEGALAADVIPGDEFSAAVQVGSGEAKLSPASAAGPDRCVFRLAWERGAWVATKQACTGDARQLTAVAK